MNQLLVLPVLFLALLVGNPASSADLNKDADAYEKGDIYSAYKEWLSLAKQGNAKAQFNIGLIYANAGGAGRNYNAASKWFELAAKQGHKNAQYNLGLLYEGGRGVPQNYKTAIKWYTRAAEQKYVNAQYNLGLLYGRGKGIPKDNIRAHMWWNIAATQGDSGSKRNLDKIEKKMSPNQIKTARRLAREWEKEHCAGFLSCLF